MNGPLTGPICPLQPGYGIGLEAEVGEGTFGCVVRDLKDGELLILSCNHVIANSNDAKEGDIIMHPASARNDLGPLPTAALKRYKEIEFVEIGTPVENAPKNKIDAAVARPLAPIDPYIPHIGIPKGVHVIDIQNPPVINPLNEFKVKMVGAVSNYQEGKVVEWVTAAPFRIFGDTGKSVLFDPVMMCELKIEEGDSGSLVLDNHDNALGIVMAKDQVNPNNAYVILWQFIQSELEVELITESIWNQEYS